ncbi:MAG: hypothetical protein FJY39_12035, partial [Betaproteobacteria bacterium]|nr:hypothetical protein [Betaproteobacteria bacterium]
MRHRAGIQRACGLGLDRGLGCGPGLGLGLTLGLALGLALGSDPGLDLRPGLGFILWPSPVLGHPVAVATRILAPETLAARHQRLGCHRIDKGPGVAHQQ